MPNEVWLIETGEYDDRQVIAVAADPDVASAWADKWTVDSFDVEASGYGRRAYVGGRVPFVTETTR